KFKLVAPPNPGWTYGQKIDCTTAGKTWSDGENAGWKIMDTSKEDAITVYQTLIAGISPKPVAFVSSLSASGSANLAPFSWFNQVTHSPPVLSVSILHKLNGEKDTLRNIKETKDFTVNIISEPWVEQANSCAINAPIDVSEWDVSGLTKADSIYVKAPRVKESAFSMECELLQTVDITNPTTNTVTTTMVLGSMKAVHMRKDILNEHGVPDIGKLKPVARLGGTHYIRVSESYSLPNVKDSWDDEGEKI
ncbi:hypothetical protein CPB83DRAFT_744656, partial [Crepidotus variabilis]